MAKDLTYTNGVIAVKENKLLGDRLFKLCDVTAEEAFRTVTESGFGRGAEVTGVQDFEKLLSADEADIDAFIREYAPTDAEKEYLLSPRDYHNAKAAVKAKYLGEEADKMLAPDGLYSAREIVSCVNDGDLSPLDSELAAAVEEAEKFIAKAQEAGDSPAGAEIGAIFDRALYRRLFKACRRNSFLKEQLAAKADMNNILVCMRSDSFDFARGNFFAGGKLSENTLLGIFSEKDKERALDGTEYKDFYLGCLEAKQSGKPMTEGERTLESFETLTLQKRKYELTKSQPFLYYIFRRRAENANLRILFVCLAAGMDERGVRSRLRVF